MAATYRWKAPPSAPGRRPPLPTRVLRTLRARFVAWFLWPHTVRGWWKTLSTELAPADLYHSCGTLPIAAALAARRRDRRAGRRSVVILDVIDITMESNNVLGIPPLIRRMLDRRERGWARRADAHTAVNDVFADKAVARWRLPRRPTVVPNYPEPWTPPPGAERPDLIRAATGLPATTRICLFWGRLGPYVGLDEAAEAVLLVPDTALVLLGFGRGWEPSVARDADPRYAGRHVTLPAVHPDELAPWVASADVALCTLPPLSFNQRFTTPNKFLEAMTAGTPMVLGPDLPTMEELLRREDLGRVAASMAPADIAAAIAAILAVPPDEREAWRARIRAAARARYSWPIAAAAYRGLVEEVAPAP
jgi:glycosyltransferase involved in cell wall biosynthesis